MLFNKNKKDKVEKTMLENFEKDFRALLDNPVIEDIEIKDPKSQKSLTVNGILPVNQNIKITSKDIPMEEDGQTSIQTYLRDSLFALNNKVAYNPNQFAKASEIKKIKTIIKSQNEIIESQNQKIDQLFSSVKILTDYNKAKQAAINKATENRIKIARR